MKDVKLIGITGEVGAGKSKLLQYIKDNCHCEMYLTDDVAKEVRAKGTDAYNQMVALFGSDVLDKDGEIRNDIVAARMYADVNLKEALEDIIHPKVIAYLVEKCDNAKKAGVMDFVFIESAIIEKIGIIMDSLDEIWYIHADELVRKERLRKHRGYDYAKASSIISTQPSETYFRRLSDVVIDNSADLESSYAQIELELSRLLGLTPEPDDEKETKFILIQEKPLSLSDVKTYVSENEVKQ